MRRVPRLPGPLRGRMMALATALGLGRRAFLLPYRHAAGVRPCDYAPLEPLFAAAEPAMLAHLDHIEAHGDTLAALGGAAPAPRFDQGWFPRLDAAAAYAMVRVLRPRRIVEVGSGHSTRFLARAVADGGLDCAITCIDPDPRADLAGLALTHHACLLADAPEALFTDLAPGDILFVDSSHLLVPGSDVDRLLNRVLPRLRSDVRVHIHDIFLPDAYPEPWAWRGYNEQSAIACLLQGGGWRLEFASHYLVTRHRARIEAGIVGRLGLMAGARESSLWLQKRPGAGSGATP